jgi:hypothetical protein
MSNRHRVVAVGIFLGAYDLNGLNILNKWNA